MNILKELITVLIGIVIYYIAAVGIAFFATDVSSDAYTFAQAVLQVLLIVFVGAVIFRKKTAKTTRAGKQNDDRS